MRGWLYTGNNVEKFKHVGTKLTSQNNEKNKFGEYLKPPGLEILSTNFPSRYSIKFYDYIIFPAALYGCKNWSLTLNKHGIICTTGRECIDLLKI